MSIELLEKFELTKHQIRVMAWLTQNTEQAAILMGEKTADRSQYFELASELYQKGFEELAIIMIYKAC